MVIIWCIVSVHNLGYGQIFTPDDRQVSISDTLSDNDTIINKGGLLTLFEGKPGRAALYGLLLPGGGQIYNKRWWKVPIAVGLDATAVWWLSFNARNYTISQAEFLVAFNTNENVSFYRAKRDLYRKNKEYAYLYLIGAHLLTVMEAYVDRHMMDFNVSDDLTLGGKQVYTPPVFANVRFKIPLNKSEKKIIHPFYPTEP